MKASLVLFAVTVATAQPQFNERREFNTAVRLAGPGFFQQGGSLASRSSFNNNSNQQRQSFSTSGNNNFQDQNNNFQSASFGSDRNLGSAQSFQNNNQFQSGQSQQNQQNTFASNSLQQNRGNQFQSTNTDNNFPQNQFQNSQAQQNSQNQLQTSFERDNSRNRITLLENVQLTPSTRFQTTSGQQPSGIAFLQSNRNQQNSGDQFQGSNSASNFRSNDNNRFSTGSQSQSSAQFRSGSSSSSEFDGVFEPLNLPSGASAILGSISTSFSCVERPYGYYADQDNSCRVFHICNPYLFSDGEVQTYQYSFMCGEGTIFDQNEMTCKAEYDATPCQEAQNFYFRNEEFGLPEEKSL
ncbi:GATA zinc finger domain-containing protein 14-like [Macrobrachium nipponense]|uniref:GATA zinc finger domain-containing protein 14-like n=1 Tax=Macrobrachium nipponense TaxID=159736 RepID=UPI0030C87381